MIEQLHPPPLQGLLVGTLGVAGYGRATAQLRRLIQEAGKACYMFLVGKPSPAKLANFPEIEVPPLAHPCLAQPTPAKSNLCIFPSILFRADLLVP